ncbi:MAG: fructose-6-phosphate aldolase [Cyanobacteria bacterium HKST-UBA04]|nr:fructose-6-phosphate aldolase [Cyanobacteria bacterium HKST-UBA04]
MQLFVDTANLDEIQAAAALGVISGVTTNPTLLAKNNHGDVKSVIQQIAKLVPHGPISVECVTDDAESMIREGETFVTWSDNIAVKVPMTVEGMKAVHHFSNNGIKTNVTLVFSANQALLAANAGATFISSFVGRVDDIGFDGIGIIREVAEIIELHSFNSQVLAASIRHPLHVTQSAAAGAHIATIPFKVIKQMYDHPLTEKGVASFKADWDQLQKSNLTPA